MNTLTHSRTHSLTHLGEQRAGQPGGLAALVLHPHRYSDLHVTRSLSHSVTRNHYYYCYCTLLHTQDLIKHCDPYYLLQQSTRSLAHSLTQSRNSNDSEEQ